MSIFVKSSVFAAAVLSLSISSCHKHDSAAGGVALGKSGTLVVCTHIPYAPFEFPKDGKISGFDVDIVDLVAKKLGVKSEFIDTQVDHLKSGAALDSGKCDVVAAGLTITEARRKNVDFSSPYFDVSQALVAKRDAGITSLETLKGKRVGAQAQTTGEDFITSRGFTPIPFESADALLAALRAERVDAVVEDHPVAESWMKDAGNIGFQIVAYLETGEQLGIAVKKGNTQLLGTVNEVLAQARADGTYQRLHAQWFGQSLGVVPAAVAKP